jgi:cytochrome c-type biogenesis protein CcmH
MRIRSVLPLVMVWLAVLGCDRNMEPFVPGEEPQPPDLAKIFPAGAERTAAPVSQAAPTPSGGRGAAPVSESGAAIEGTVELAPGLAERIPPDSVLFVIARTGQGGPPLAVKRIVSPSFPFDFRIGPEDRMIQAMPFVGPIQISARIDRDGNAMTRDPGDLESRVATGIEPGATGLVIAIDETI